MNQPVRDWVRGEVLVRRSQPVRDVVEVGRSHHWRFRPMGRAVVPAMPVRLEDWLVVPVEQDSSLIPSQSLERVQALHEAGIRPKAFVLAHETTHALASPSRPEWEQTDRAIDWSEVRNNAQVKARQLAQHLPNRETVGSASVCVLTVLGIAAGALAAVPILLVGAVGAAILVDPILIAVTEDDYWVEIDRWWVQ